MLGAPGWLFIENPKTGTRSAEDALLRAGAEKIQATHSTLMTYHSKDLPPLRFVVVRNPWDRMVSAWAYNSKGVGSFGSWLTGPAWEAGVGLDLKRCPQRCWAWQCNFVLRFERLEEEWDKMCEKLKLSNAVLKHLNGSDHSHYRDVYTSKTRELVADRFAPDIVSWKYTF